MVNAFPFFTVMAEDKGFNGLWVEGLNRVPAMLVYRAGATLRKVPTFKLRMCLVLDMMRRSTPFQEEHYDR